MNAFIIAEAGSAWRFGPEQQQLSIAREAIEIAKRCGADAVKFQWTSDPRLMEQRRNVPEGSYNILAWPEKWIKHLATHCEECEIEFMCSIYLPCDVEKLNPYVKRWKVASLEADDTRLIESLLSTKKSVIVSFGCSADSGKQYANEEISNLHCTASYPAPMSSLNLSAINKGSYSGYSDHSRNKLTGALAVACGAKIIEVHFKLFHTPVDNPDCNHSLYQEELRQYIENIRQAELMLGDGVKKIMPCEEWALKHKVKS